MPLIATLRANSSRYPAPFDGMVIQAVNDFEGDATGATGIVKVDDGAASRLGLVWLGEDRWAPDLDAAAESAIVRTMLAGRSIYFSGPEQVTERVYRWDLTRIGAGIADLRARCG